MSNTPFPPSLGKQSLPTAPAVPGKAALPAAKAPLAAAPAPKLPAAAPARSAASASAPPRPFSAKKAENRHATKQFLFDMIDKAGEDNTSDIHIHPGIGRWNLVSGKLTKYDDADSIISEDDIVHWMTHADGYEDMGVDDPLKLFGERGHTTVAFDTGTWRVRGSFRESTVGVSATFRLIPSTIPTISDVYLPQMMVDMIRRRSGLILIEGPTGSGKTTSIAALIDYINSETDQHIYSVEDPIEFYHVPKGNTVFTMREIGVHASDYPSAVENALRSKPNIIFVGEMLNNATKKAALHASTTGHLVITTAHAGSVTEALDSFIGEFPADEQAQIRTRLSTSIIGVMCQTLVPTKTGGLVAAREIMTSNLNFQSLIKAGETNLIAAQMESGENCQSFEDDLLQLVKNDQISAQVALLNAKRPDAMRMELERNQLL